MKQAIHSKILLLVFLLLTIGSFAQQQKDTRASNVPQSANEVSFTSVLNAHLNAVSTKNLEA
ncbi:hypothetical protein ACU8V7_06380 [Zobellia nedashkovskayae]|uniref:hypothetical protein n=1 Tax=Zobellia TaxID=112040 RepID=UPI00188BA6C8|nr:MULTISPECIES: hypothetical protein [Zobellia]MBU2947403.1 hypothetical protein [Zobellia uliginosa]